MNSHIHIHDKEEDNKHKCIHKCVYTIYIFIYLHDKEVKTSASTRNNLQITLQTPQKNSLSHGRIQHL